jgi:hypothetical protein
MKPMEASAVYAKAAKLMEDGYAWTGGSCCWAIQLAKNPALMIGNSRGDPHCKAMKALYAPRSGEAYWMGDPKDATANSVRILALCFMAAITGRRR